MRGARMLGVLALLATTGCGGGEAGAPPPTPRAGERPPPAPPPRAGGSPEAAGETSPPPLGRREASDPPAARLERAKALAREASAGGPREPERVALALEAFRAIAEDPRDRLVAAEAAFREGELLRSRGELAAATAAFRRARESGRGSAFRARAGLELGHVERRRGFEERALDAYLSVASDPDTAPDRREEALLWAARVLADDGRAESARRLWWIVAERADDPLQRIRAFDALARDCVERGDPEGAAGVLQRCRNELASESARATERGERVRRALAGMRCIGAIERAVAARHGGVRIRSYARDERRGARDRER